MILRKIHLLVVLLSPLPLFAGAWTQPRGSYYAQLSYWRFSSTTNFDSNQKISLANAAEFEEESIYAYETNLKQRAGAPPLGDGQTDFELRVLVGRSILRSAAYVNLVKKLLRERIPLLAKSYRSV